MMPTVHPWTNSKPGRIAAFALCLAHTGFAAPAFVALQHSAYLHLLRNNTQASPAPRYKMAVYDNSEFSTSRIPSMMSTAAYRVADFIDQAAADLRHYIVKSQTERALSQLSNRQLEDIGIARWEIAEFSAGKARRWG